MPIIRSYEEVRPVLDPRAVSVVDSDHPANNASHNENGTYTFRQRQTNVNLTLGWELEANHNPSRVPTGVRHISDGSVDGDGSEFVVLPAITRSPKYVLGLLKDLVHAPKLNTDDSCGFHVHISAANIASITRLRQWAIATERLAYEIEEQAFNAVPKSRQENSYCRKISLITSGTSFIANKYDNSRRYHWLNTVEMFRPGGIRTIENRLLGHTHRWKYLLAWTLFTMELGQRGWNLTVNPFDLALHKDALNEMLNKITKDIKPLEKRHEPIPQWVYDGLKMFDIGENAFTRPLASLSETESRIIGTSVRVYSDNQPELPNDDEDESDSCPSCPCGCGEEGRCTQQTHDDGDCDSTECIMCHSNSDCAGRGLCYYCIQESHDNDEYCRRSICGTCVRAHRVPSTSRSSPITVQSMAVTVDENTLSMTDDERRMSYYRAVAYNEYNERGGL